MLIPVFFHFLVFTLGRKIQFEWFVECIDHPPPSTILLPVTHLEASESR